MMPDFAPISSGPSGRLRFAAGYFALLGGSSLVLLALALFLPPLIGRAVGEPVTRIVSPFEGLT